LTDCEVTSNLAYDKYTEVAAIGMFNGMIKIVSLGTQAAETCIVAHEAAVTLLLFVHGRAELLSVD
jgi:hypothetical protein